MCTYSTPVLKAVGYLLINYKLLQVKKMTNSIINEPTNMFNTRSTPCIGSNDCYEIIKQYFRADGTLRARVLLNIITKDYIAEITHSTGRITCSLHLLQQCASKVCEDFIKRI